MGKQFLERMTVIPVGDHSVLEGLFHAGRGGDAVVLVPSLPHFGSDMNHTVLAELAWALTRAGHATLRFNFRGVGASSGRLSLPPAALPGSDDPLPAVALEEAYEDLGAVITQHLETTGMPRCAVVGYAFGAHAACRAAVEHPAVERVVLIAPLVSRLPLDGRGLAASGVPTTILCGQEDALARLDEVRAAFGAVASLIEIPEANHAFARGLSALGRQVVACFPTSLESPDEGTTLTM